MERTEAFEKQIRDEVYGFFAEQCSIDIAQLNDDTDIVGDIGGDSLMFLQMLEGWKQEHNIDIEFRVIGKYLIKNPVDTIGKAINLALLIICEREKFMEMVK